MDTEEPNRYVSDRGFITYDDFTNPDGFNIAVRESSTARADEVWVATLDSDHNGTVAAFGMESALRLRDALDAWIRDHSNV